MLNEALRVKFSPMNSIHEQEMIVLNDLLEALKLNEKVEEKFAIFFEDVEQHFAFEEKLMEKYGFFAKVPHKMEHDRIIKELIAIKNAKLDTKELQEYFEEYFIPWLENHIQTLDTVTAGYFDMVGATVEE